MSSMHGTAVTSVTACGAAEAHAIGAQFPREFDDKHAPQSLAKTMIVALAAA